LTIKSFAFEWLEEATGASHAPNTGVASLGRGQHLVSGGVAAGGTSRPQGDYAIICMGSVHIM